MNDHGKNFLFLFNFASGKYKLLSLSTYFTPPRNITGFRPPTFLIAGEGTTTVKRKRLSGMKQEKSFRHSLRVKKFSDRR